MPAPAAKPVEAVPAPSDGDAHIEIKRGMPGNAEQIARFKTRMIGQPVDRLEVMMAFGQKSYLLAENQGGEMVALIGWQVENLITRADEFLMLDSAPRDTVVRGLVNAIEEASRELQSEVGFILLPSATPAPVIQSFVSNGYESVTLEKIRVPAWREAVHEMIGGSGAQILSKKLREDRIMKPI